VTLPNEDIFQLKDDVDGDDKKTEETIKMYIGNTLSLSFVEYHRCA
jgi:hypothetical protein